MGAVSGGGSPPRPTPVLPARGDNVSTRNLDVMVALTLYALFFSWAALRWGRR
jgi:hypothetical protein